jgi:hypothetical protein
MIGKSAGQIQYMINGKRCVEGNDTLSKTYMTSFPISNVSSVPNQLKLLMKREMLPRENSYLHHL